MKRTRRRPALLCGAVLLAAVLLASFLSCASSRTKREGLAPDQLYQLAMKKVARKKYFAARTLLQEALPRIPPEDRVLLPRVQLAIADAFFDDGGLLNYGEALNGYRNFLVYFPDDSRADHAQYMVGMSLFKQVLSPDRDQALTLKAIEEFRKVDAAYPDSSYVTKARRSIEDCFDLLAEHERVVGEFYRKRKAWKAAIDRYRGLLDKYPRYSKTEDVLFALGSCLLKDGQRTAAGEAFGRLQHDYPDGKPAARVKGLLDSYDRDSARRWAREASS